MAASTSGRHSLAELWFDEMGFSLTHTLEMDLQLPGLPPTGRETAARVLDPQRPANALFARLGG